MWQIIRKNEVSVDILEKVIIIIIIIIIIHSNNHNNNNVPCTEVLITQTFLLHPFDKLPYVLQSHILRYFHMELISET
jgi:hypothetical protein